MFLALCQSRNVQQTRAPPRPEASSSWDWVAAAVLFYPGRLILKRGIFIYLFIHIILQVPVETLSKGGEKTKYNRSNRVQKHYNVVI